LGVTLSDPLMVRETVAVDTLASRATSRMFIGSSRYSRLQVADSSGA
jgi:hypothetical protein